jgi:hypothetical protein
MDVPSGPAVILFLGVALLLALLIKKLNLFGFAERKGTIPETAGDI